MNVKHCPHCGNTLSANETTCPCGFDFVVEGSEVPAPAIVRSAARHEKRSPAKPRAQVATMTPPRAKQDKPRAKTDARIVPKTGGEVRPNEAMLMACPSCRARISQRAHQCPKCKSAPYDHCHICATRILVNVAPCPECGDPAPFDVT